MSTPVTKTYKAHETLFTIPAAVVLPFIGVANRIKVKGFSEHIYIPCRLDRLFPFKGSPVCYGCGRIGTFFAVQRSKAPVQKGAWELNFYSAEGHLMTCDHLVPKAKGGQNVPDNYGTLCQKCNSKKGSRDLEEFIANRNHK